MADKQPKKTLLQRYEEEAIKNNLPLLSRESIDWFLKKGQNMKKGTAEGIRSNLLGGDALGQMPKRYPGHMFLYHYDAKWDEELPYWDEFPLIIHLGPWADKAGHTKGWAGINLHYLPPVMRAKLFDALVAVFADKALTDDTKFKLSYNILRKAAKYRYFKPCYKHYLFTQLRSKMIFIPSYEWEKVVFLPLQRFKKADTTTVWADSKRIIGK